MLVPEPQRVDRSASFEQLLADACVVKMWQTAREVAVGLKPAIVAAQEVSKGQRPALKANISSLFSQRASVGV